MAYQSIASQLAGDPAAIKQEEDRVKAAWAASGGAAMTREEKTQKYGDVINSTLGGLSGNSNAGYVTSDGAHAQTAQSQYGATVTPYTYGDYAGQYSVTGVDRTGSQTVADYSLMTDGDYAIVQQLKAEYEAAKARGDTAAMNAAHQEAERIRAGYGYLGGTDGSMYIRLPEETNPTGNDYVYSGSSASTGGSSGGTGYGTGNDMNALLDQWREAAQAQSDGRIDYAVQQAVAELERALADAQPQFKEQAEAVAKDELQALDNSALYAEARGDKGGIGQSQYNEIQAAAAQNRLAVQQAQTKLTTDTQRQIADLRAQGEFEKADAALEISQQYLSQLIGLEQWAAEFGLSAAQFEESVRQWEAEYQLAMQQFQTSVDQWNAEYDLSVGQLTGQLSDGTLTLSGQSQLASMGEALLSAGIMPTTEQLSAMGMTQSQATAWLTAQQLEAASASSGSGSGKVSSGSGNSGTGIWDTISGMTDRSQVWQYLLNSDLPQWEVNAWMEEWDAAAKKTKNTESLNSFERVSEDLQRLRANGASDNELWAELDGIVADMERYGISEEDIIELLRKLGLSVTIN